MTGIGFESDLLKLILGAMFTLVLTSFAYTYRGLSSIWKRLSVLEDNHLHVVKDRLSTLEQRVTRIESGLESGSESGPESRPDDE